MPTFKAPDGLELAYSVYGDGVPVVCLAGGPMISAAYFGDLGGLSSRLRLIVLDYRGTGQSERPADVSTYRCDRLVGDVEALRQHLGAEQLNLLAHSAGANLGLLYAAAHPTRVARLALITPSVFAVGVEVTADVRREVIWLAGRRAVVPGCDRRLRSDSGGHGRRRRLGRDRSVHLRSVGRRRAGAPREPEQSAQRRG